MRKFLHKLSPITAFLIAGLAMAALVFTPRTASYLLADHYMQNLGNCGSGTGYTQDAFAYGYNCGSQSAPYYPPVPKHKTQYPHKVGHASVTHVKAEDDFFAPAHVTVPAGTTVTWTNTGRNPHTVTSDDGTVDSGTLMPGQSFSYTFHNAGTWKYYCRFHGAPGGIGMSGSVTVSGGGKKYEAKTYPTPAYPYHQAPSYQTSVSTNVAVGVFDPGFAQRQYDSYYGPLYPQYYHQPQQHSYQPQYYDTNVYDYNSAPYYNPAPSYYTGDTYGQSRDIPNSGEFDPYFAQREYDAYYAPRYPHYYNQFQNTPLLRTQPIQPFPYY